MRASTQEVQKTYEKTYDVIIVGAGPAGSTVARLCAAEGLETLLLDKKEFPREKPCGGGLTLAAVNELEKTGLDLPPDIPEAKAYMFRAFSGHRRIEVSFAEPYCYLVKRATFDAFLLEKARAAGACFMGGIDVTEVASETVQRPPLMQVRASNRLLFKGRVVVGADGALSKVAKAIRRPLPPKDTGFCLSADIPKEDFRNPISTDTGLDIWYGFVPHGYGWVFPKRETYSIGLGASLSSFRNPKAALREFLLKLKGSDNETTGEVEALAKRFKGHFIPIGGYIEPVVADGIVLVGDAAGFADPFTGEGIRYAITSGRLAAEAIISCLKKGLPPTRYNLLPYERAAKTTIGPNLRYAKWLGAGFYRSPGRLLDIYFSDPEACRVCLGILTGDTTYRALLKPLILKVGRRLILSR
ncbi:MAG TPA: NAD(P)/FAD-dependent oxidoreductase [Clostridia bacterium]|nr:NAD(P)/FAD-dependent oxidoreductase [Clostridia bacterium]